MHFDCLYFSWAVKRWDSNKMKDRKKKKKQPRRKVRYETSTMLYFPARSNRKIKVTTVSHISTYKKAVSIHVDLYMKKKTAKWAPPGLVSDRQTLKG